MITFSEIPKSFIKEKYRRYFHERGRYFEVFKNKYSLCFYGLIDYTNKVCEAFWVLDSFKGIVFTKDFLISTFDHLFSLDYNKFYTWSREPKIIRMFNRFKYLGIEVSDPPVWDEDPTKTWFIRRA